MAKKIEYDRSDVDKYIPSLLELLTDAERDEVIRSVEIKAYRPGDLIYAEGASPDCMFCAARGKVKIFRHGVCGRNQIVRLLRPGEYFGYRASLAAEPYVTAAAAFDAAVVCAIPMPLIKRIMRENNDFCLFLISQLSIDLGIADRRLVSLTQKHLRARLAEALLFLRDTYGTDRSGRYLDIRLTREDLASLANMTTPNAIRTLISFDHEGLIVLHGRSICLLDEEALYHISDCG